MLDKRSDNVNANRHKSIVYSILLLFIILGYLTNILFPLTKSRSRIENKLNVATSINKHEANERPNILLITVDALRADHLSCYGYKEKTSPYLDSLALKGVLFENYYTHASWTYPSMASLLTSLYPRQHGIMSFGKDLKLGTQTLGGLLSAAGYTTASFGEKLYESGSFGFDHAISPENYLFEDDDSLSIFRCDIFQVGRIWSPIIREKLKYIYLRGNLKTWYIEAERMNVLVLKWLRNAKKPFFLHVHYQDPHEPYVSHPMPFFISNRMTESNKEKIIVLYDGEISYLDSQIENFINAFTRVSSLKKTIIIITADHGEEFLDHGNWSHGRTLYNELINVPLIIVWEGTILPNKRVKPIVRQIDISPTVLDFLHLPIPSTMMGESLSPILFGDTAYDRPIISQVDTYLDEKDSIRIGRYKLILTRNKNDKSIRNRELYDCLLDSKESENISLKDPNLTEYLENQLSKLYKSTSYTKVNSH